MNGNYSAFCKFNTVGMPFNFKKLLKRDNFSGHVNYSAPELILEKQNFTNKVDTWSLGCCIYFMLAKKDPFDGRSPQETKFNILNHQFDRCMNLDKFCTEKLTDPLLSNILMNCFAIQDNARPTCKQIADML